VTRSTRTRVLWVTDEPPDRSLGGGNIRQAMLLDALRDRIEVTLLLTGRLDDEMTRRHVAEVLELRRPRPRPLHSHTRRRLHHTWRAIARRRPSELVDAVRVRRIIRPVLNQLSDDFDAVLVHHLHLAPLLPARRRVPWLLHLFDVSSERMRQELANERGRRQRWLLGRDVAKAARYEERAAVEYDGLVLVSDRDAGAVAGPSLERARGPVVVVPNGVDVWAIAPTPLPAAPNILLPASFSYRPNVLGAVWFCDDVLPLVRAEVPEVQFHLVGRQPVDEVVALASRPGVQIHADVPVMAPWLARSRVVVVPLHIGTGTRLKALEAMAAGRPVVGTSIGLEGLGVSDGRHARIADDPANMADAVVELLRCDATAQRLAASGRRLVEERYSWDDLAARFADGLDALLESRDLTD
jgi:glycosyltransferase involved in cell wall biosynthesis